MTFSWDGLLHQLGECEKATIAAKRAGDKGVEQAQEKINLMTVRLAESCHAHLKEMEEMEALSNRQLHDVEAKAEKEVTSANQAREKAVARIQAAEARKVKAEAESKGLEMQLRELCRLVDEKAAESDARCTEIMRKSDEQVDHITASANRRVSDLSSFAEEVRHTALSSMEEMQGQHSDGITKSDERATVRSRFQEMCTLTKMLEDHKMNQKQYEEAKARVMGTWHNEWDKSTATPTNGKSNPLTPRSVNILSSVGDTPDRDIVGQPSSEDFLRSHLLNKLDL